MRRNSSSSRQASSFSARLACRTSSRAERSRTAGSESVIVSMSSWPTCDMIIVSQCFSGGTDIAGCRECSRVSYRGQVLFHSNDRFEQ